MGFKLLLRLDGEHHFRARRDDRDMVLGRRRRKHIGALGRAVFFRVLQAKLRQVLPRQRDDARSPFGAQCDLPALRRLDDVGRAEHVQVRDRTQGGQVFDRLVCRTVFAKADGVMRHDVDDALFHQRRKADRRTAVIGKHEERAGVGHHAAMQRHAVHRSRHAVLAHAVMDKASLEVIGLDRFHALRARVVRARQVGRPANGFRHMRIDHFEHHF